MTKSGAFFEILTASVFWGFGFVATVWCLRDLDSLSLVFYRFTIAFLCGALVLIAQRKSKKLLFMELKLSMIPSLFLWLTLFLQTWGLEYTTATNSTFITTLYVVLVPLMSSLAGHEKLNWQHWFCVVLALIGTGFIIRIQDLHALNWGDLLTLLCAIFAALHIIVIGQRTMRTKDAFAFNTFQTLWMALLSLLLFPFMQKSNLWVISNQAWFGLVALGAGSSLIAFYLQIRAQRVLSPSVVSLLCLLESPMSCIFAFWLLHEHLGAWQWLGAGLILLACALISRQSR